MACLPASSGGRAHSKPLCAPGQHGSLDSSSLGMPRLVVPAVMRAAASRAPAPPARPSGTRCLARAAHCPKRQHETRRRPNRAKEAGGLGPNRLQQECRQTHRLALCTMASRAGRGGCCRRGAGRAVRFAEQCSGCLKQGGICHPMTACMLPASYVYVVDRAVSLLPFAGSVRRIPAWPVQRGDDMIQGQGARGWVPDPMPMPMPASRCRGQAHNQIDEPDRCRLRVCTSTQAPSSPSTVQPSQGSDGAAPSRPDPAPLPSPCPLPACCQGHHHNNHQRRTAQRPTCSNQSRRSGPGYSRRVPAPGGGSKWHGSLRAAGSRRRGHGPDSAALSPPGGPPRKHRLEPLETGVSEGRASTAEAESAQLRCSAIGLGQSVHAASCPLPIWPLTLLAGSRFRLASRRARDGKVGEGDRHALESLELGGEKKEEKKKKKEKKKKVNTRYKHKTIAHG